MGSIDKIVIISGLSGSGKSVALRAFEDIGYFCIDNMPISLLPKFLDLPTPASFQGLKIALVMDIRLMGWEENYREIIDSLRERGIKLFIVFLDSSDEVLINRFKMTRRHHPLNHLGSLPEVITKERQRMAAISESADLVIDTSNFTVHNLSYSIRQRFADDAPLGQFNIIIYSFGFGLGVPRDADLVLDVRFLPNPFFQKKLKDLTGNDLPVVNYIMESEETRKFLSLLYPLLDYLGEKYQEGRTFLVIAVGCTGGRHRSVCIANEMQKYLAKREYLVDIIHRDLDISNFD
jgi:UPF0042 nucleotide-binding protein